MPVKLFASNSLQQLSTLFSDDLRRNTEGVFDQPTIVTQTEGLNNWLRIRIAETQGIAAHLSFYSPADVLFQVYRALTGKSFVVQDNHMTEWMLFEALAQPDFCSTHSPISVYYKDNDIKRHALAVKLADLFDQYQVYRPTIIQEWNKGNFRKPASFKWQFDLWQYLCKAGGKAFSDKSKLTELIQDALKNPEATERLKQTFPRIYFFGLAILTPFHLQVFNELSEYISIDFYLLNPSPEYYWMDNITEECMQRKLNKNKKLHENNFLIGNDLLLNLGKIVKDSFWTLFQHEELINAYDTPCNEIPGDHPTLLNKIKQDIYNNAPPKERNEILDDDLNDGSVLVQSAYTPVREVEMLYNYLVQIAERDKDQFIPKDVLVMVSDIDKYAPYIRAVFDNAPYPFPYSIADEALAGGNGFFSGLDKLIKLDEQDVTAESILDLLENKYIRDRFHITDTGLIRRALRDAGVRFGTKNSTENETRYLSLEYGLKRIKTGLCISGGELYDDGGDVFYPLDLAEGADSSELIRFCYFAEQLLEYWQDKKSPRKISKWTAFIREWTDKMLMDMEESEDDDLLLWQKYLEKQLAGSEQLESVISFDVFRRGIQRFLHQEKRQHRFLRKGITFCSFIPMRSVPFRVVAMLGLNYDTFPRKEQPIRFSLITHEAQRGDRDVKENDKHLFLESILSAREYLYLSYIGSNAKDNTPQPPSTLLEALVDYIFKGYQGKVQQDKWVIDHPLQGFSQRYASDRRLVNYINDLRHKEGEIPQTPTPPAPKVTMEEMELSSLISFLKQPIKWYFNKVLHIYYNDENLLISENEQINFTKLKESILRKDLMLKTSTEAEEYILERVRKGELALANQGRHDIHKIRISREIARLLLMDITEKATPESVEIKVGINGINIIGKIPVYDENKLVIFNSSSKIYSNWLHGYMYYLMMISSGNPVDYYFIELEDENKNKIRKLPANALDKDKAIEKLNFVLTQCLQAQTLPFYFGPMFKDPLKIVNNSESDFAHEAKNQINDDWGTLKYDAYLKKGLEYGYFSAEHHADFKENAEILFEHYNKTSK